MKKGMVFIFIILLIIPLVYSFSLVDLLEKINFLVRDKSDFVIGYISYGSYGSYGACTDECSTNGLKECSGDGYRTCGNYDTIDSCLEWSTVNSCNTGEICQDGSCVSINECTPNWRCSMWGSCINNQQTRNCNDKNDCGTTNNQPALSQSCVLGCTDECSTNGLKECSGNGYRTCGNYDSDSCLEWSNVNLCIQSQICLNGLCINSNSNLTQGTCSDNTRYNGCSVSKPRFCDAGILKNKCSLCGCSNNGECQLDGSCISKPKGIQSDNLSLIDRAPIFSYISSLMIDIDKTSLIILSKYANDPENQKIEFSFEDGKKSYNSDIIDCSINQDKLSCDKPKRYGNVKLLIFASDGIKKSSSQILIKISPTNPIENNDNKAPTANAGEDKTVAIGSMILLDGSKSYDREDSLQNLLSNYIWYEDGIEIGRGVNLQKIFLPGIHKIVLQVINSEGLSSTDTVIITVKSKERCLDTSATYVPDDTICNKKWPSQEGQLLNLNSPGYSCNLVEVCDENLDPIIEDSINCCSENLLPDNQAKNNACNFAQKYSNSNTKKCQALYLTESLGGNSIYMKDYFELEMCCRGVSELCSNQKYLYSARPLPKTGRDLSDLRCPNTPNDNPPGKWVSDTKLDLNNAALQDVPTHVSLNVLSTGTCVDYSFSLTTLLRKAGYKKDEIYTVESPDHAYNLIKLPLDRKYTIIDTTGNNNPAIIFGKTPLGYKYCENIRKCYNDNGEALCPNLDEIYGCENVKQNLAQKTNVIGFKTTEIIDKVAKLVKTELER